MIAFDPLRTLLLRRDSRSLQQRDDRHGVAVAQTEVRLQPGDDLTAFHPKRTLGEPYIVASAFAAPNFHSRPRIGIQHGHGRVELLGQGLDEARTKARLSAFTADWHSGSIVGHGQQPGAPFVGK